MILRRFILTLLALYLAAIPLMAQTPPEEPLRIGTHQSPPFAMKSDDGSWSGISIEFLGLLSDEMGVRVELVETDLEGLITDVAEGRLDASIAAITVTFERERIVDFSYPYFLSGLGVAVASQSGSNYVAILEAVTSRDFLATIGVLIGAGICSATGFQVLSTILGTAAGICASCLITRSSESAEIS